jgi:hypothetical protein
MMMLVLVVSAIFGGASNKEPSPVDCDSTAQHQLSFSLTLVFENE